jgi:hypothetical protein
MATCSRACLAFYEMDISHTASERGGCCKVRAPILNPDEADELVRARCVLDGEATGVWGKRGTVAYQVFDVLWLEARYVPLWRSLGVASCWASCRRERRRVAALDERRPWERACEEGWEGRDGQGTRRSV